MADRDHLLMRAALALALLLAPAASRAQPASPPPQPSPPVAMTLAELDWLIQQAADTPARWSYGALQMLLAKRQQATAPAAPQEPVR